MSPVKRMDDIRFSAGARSLEIKSADTFRPPFTLLRRRRLIEMNLRLSSLLKSRDIAQVARADMKPVVSGPFESGGFFRFAGDFSSPLRSKSFPFLCKKENMERPRATFMPVFPPHFQPAESIRVHAGPRKGGPATLLFFLKQQAFAKIAPQNALDKQIAD